MKGREECQDPECRGIAMFQHKSYQDYFYAKTVYRESQRERKRERGGGKKGMDHENSHEESTMYSNSSKNQCATFQKQFLNKFSLISKKMENMYLFIF